MYNRYPCSQGSLQSQNHPALQTTVPDVCSYNSTVTRPDGHGRQVVFYINLHWLILQNGGPIVYYGNLYITY